MQLPEQAPDLVGVNAIACHYQANHRVSQKLFECRFGSEHFAPPDQRSPVFHGRVTRRCRQYGDSVADFEMRPTLTRKFKQSSFGTLAATSRSARQRGSRKCSCVVPCMSTALRHEQRRSRPSAKSNRKRLGRRFEISSGDSLDFSAQVDGGRARRRSAKASGSASRGDERAMREFKARHAHMLSLPTHVSRGHHSFGPKLLIRRGEGDFD